MPERNDLEGAVEKRALESDVFFDMLVNKVADRAMEKYDQAHARSRQRLAIISTIVGALSITLLTNVGTTVVSSLRADVTAGAIESVETFLEEELPELEGSVIANTRQEVSEIVERSRFEASAAWKELTDFNAAQVLIEDFERVGSFSDIEGSRLIDLLANFANENRYREISNFPDILERAVDVFAGAQRQDLTSRLENMFGDVMLEDTGIIVTMVVTLGDALISTGFAPDKLSEGPILEEWRGNRARYQVYADAARDQGIPGLPYFYDILIACVDQSNLTDLFAVVERSALFSSRDRLQAVQTAEVAFSDADGWTSTAMERNLACLVSANRIDEYDMVQTVIDSLR